MTLLPLIVDIRKKAVQRLGLLGFLLHRKSGLSIRNGVLIRDLTERPVWNMSGVGNPLHQQLLRYLR
jgi:hypothetical protein